jgi:hypothetical protein
MSNPSKRLSFREFVAPIPVMWLHGFLTALGLRKLKSHRGAYWARKEATGEWELRVPYHPGERPF